MWQRKKGNPLFRARIWPTGTVPVRRKTICCRSRRAKPRSRSNAARASVAAEDSKKSETRSRGRMNGGLGSGDATWSNRGRGAGTTRRSGADEGGQAFGSSRAPRRVMPSRRHRVYPWCWRKKLSSMKGSLGRESAGTVMGCGAEAVLATTTIRVGATGGSAVRSFKWNDPP